MELFKVIDLLAISQLIVFIVVLARKKQLRAENRIFLILFLTSILICLLDRIQFFYHDYLNRLNFPHFYHSADPFHFLYLPMLYLYIKSIVNIDFKLKWVQIIHLIPFLVVFLNWLINFAFESAAIKYTLLKSDSLFYINPIQLKVFHTINILQRFYILAGFYLAYRYQKQIKNYVSRVYWYNSTTLYLALLPFLFSFIIRDILYRFFSISIPVDVDLLLFSSTIIFIAYKQTNFFINPPRKVLEKTEFNSATRIKKQILDFMSTTKPYLDPDISIDKLATDLSINARKLSSVLNSEFNVNFFTFINQYRIEEAKELLSAPENKNTTILEILFEVGFNNKSVFNRTFKELTSQTPTEYRKENLKN